MKHTLLTSFGNLISLISYFYFVQIFTNPSSPPVTNSPSSSLTSVMFIQPSCSSFLIKFTMKSFHLLLFHSSSKLSPVSKFKWSNFWFKEICYICLKVLKSQNKVILSSPLLYPHMHITFSEQQDRKWPFLFISMIILTDSQWGENRAYIFSRFEVLRNMIDPRENPQIMKLWTWSTMSSGTDHCFKASTSYWGGWQVANIIEVMI